MKVLLLVIAFAAVSLVWNTDAFNVSLELQGEHCSDQLTLICRHSDVPTDPNWIHNGTVEGGQLLSSAFSGAVYSFQSNTEHKVTISGVGNVQALDGYIIQCVYSIQGNLIKSNAVKYSFVPPEYRPALSLMSFTPVFSERFCTFNYTYQESCSLYPKCTPYFSVEHTVSPQSAVSNSSSGCSVEYTIRNLMRCVSYQSIATALLPNQRGNPVVMGSTVMQSPGQFTITNVSIGVDRNLINVTYMKNEPDCPGYPTERYTVDVDGVQVANLTADAVQSLAINHTNGSVTLSLPQSQPLPENAVTLNMTKYNTVPTNRSDVTGNIVTEMVTWNTSAGFNFSQESSAATNDEGAPFVGVVVGAIISVISVMTTVVVVIAIAVALVIARKRKAKAEQRSGASDHTSSFVVDQEMDRSAQPKVDLARADLAGGVVPQETTSASGDDASTVLDHQCAEMRGTDSNEEPTSQPVQEEAAEQRSGAGDHTSSYVVDQETDRSAEDECVIGDSYKHIGRQPKVDLTRGDTAGGDASSRLDHQGQRTAQGLTYVTVDHSQRRPINVPNENLDVQYTGVRFDTKAPAV